MGADCAECKNNRDILDVYSYCASLHINDSNIVGVVSCKYDTSKAEFYFEDECNEYVKVYFPDLTCACDGLCYIPVNLKPGEKYQPKISYCGNSSKCD